MRVHLIAAALVLSSLPVMSAWAQPSCPSGQQLCTHDNGSQRCFDLDHDERHCGRCGNVCRKQERCERGRCTGEADRCERGQTMCQQQNGSRRCTDTRTDESNCGHCGNVCRKQERCRNGACQWDCSGGQMFCARRGDGSPGCVDVRTDPLNCGGCGQACPSVRRHCREGRCTGSGEDGDRCDRGQTTCQQQDGTRRCTDTRTDPNNCGRCGNTCRKQERCRDGACQWDCPTGHMFCPQRSDGSPGCVDIRSDPLNCGGCGQACPSVRRHCRDGRCS